MTTSQARILLGAKPIAKYLGTTTRQVYNLVQYERLPTFRMGVKICAVPTALDDWLNAKVVESRKSDSANKAAA